MTDKSGNAPGSEDPEATGSGERQVFQRSLSLHIQGCQDALAALEGLTGMLPVKELRNSSRRGGPLDRVRDAIRLHPFLLAIDVPQGAVGGSGGVQHDLVAVARALHDADQMIARGASSVGVAGDGEIPSTREGLLDFDALRTSIAGAYAALRRVEAALCGPSDSFARRVGPTQPRPRKVRHIDAVYPEVAQASRVQGAVTVELTIGIDGSVEKAEVLISVPPLDQAALAAVRQWKYEPAHFNGHPTAVVTVETVRFVLP